MKAVPFFITCLVMLFILEIDRLPVKCEREC